jgi:hypothetical protein
LGAAATVGAAVCALGAAGIEEVEKESIATEGELHEAASRPKKGINAMPTLPTDGGIRFRIETLERIFGTGSTQNNAEKGNDLW